VKRGGEGKGSGWEGERREGEGRRKWGKEGRGREGEGREGQGRRWGLPPVQIVSGYATASSAALAVMRCPCVCRVSVTFLHSVKTN